MESYWYWFMIGLVLIVAELVLPGVFLLWLGIAALITGVISMVPIFSWQMEVFIYCIIALISIYLGRIWYNRNAQPLNSNINNPTARLIGNVYPVSEAIVGGTGAIKVDDSYWRVSGPDCPKGTMVKVVYTEGTTIEVEPIQAL